MKKFLLFAVLFVLTASALAQSPYVTITGTLQGPSGLPVKNNLISMQPTQTFFVAGSGGSSTCYGYVVQINGVQLTCGDTLNFNDSVPGAPTNGRNVIWHKSTSSPTDSISAAIVGDGNAAHYLDGTGAYSTPTGTALLWSNLQTPGADLTLTMNAHVSNFSWHNTGGVDWQWTDFDNSGNSNPAFVMTGAVGTTRTGPVLQVSTGTNSEPVFKVTAQGLINGIEVDSNGTLFAIGSGNIYPTAQYAKLRCETGLGDGLNAIASGTYLQFMCWNDSGVTWTITGITCFTDNAGTSTLNAANNAGTALLTGAVTCNNTKSTGGHAGTQSATTTLPAGDGISFTFVSDGTSKQTTWTVSLTQ